MVVIKQALRGGVAGVVGTIVMDAVTTVMYERQSKASRDRETAAMPEGKPAAELAAIKSARLLGVELDGDLSKKGASAFHWMIATVPAALFYGALGRLLRGLGRKRGLLFGIGLFIVVDEGLNTVWGLAAAPAAYPIETHLRGLAGHAVFGLATDAVYQAIN